MKNNNLKLSLNKKIIASLENEEMKKVLGGAEEPNCWKSHVLCGNTGLRTTCRSQSCTSATERGVCILCS